MRITPTSDQDEIGIIHSTGKFFGRILDGARGIMSPEISGVAREPVDLVHPSSYSVAWILIIVMTVGLSLSMALDTDTRWMQWHLSRLGERNVPSAIIFNVTLVLAAMLLVALAVRTTDELGRLRSSRPRQLGVPLIIISICLIGLSLFPSDRFLPIHNIFGYGQFFVIAALMLNITRVSPSFSKRTVIIGYCAVVVTGLLMALFHLTHLTSLIVVELVGQMFGYVWFLSLTFDLRRQM